MFADDYYRSKNIDIIAHFNSLGLETHISTSDDLLTRTIIRTTDNIESFKKYKNEIYNPRWEDLNIYNQINNVISIVSYDSIETENLWNNI
jgi:hypothetical protein